MNWLSRNERLLKEIEERILAIENKEKMSDIDFDRIKELKNLKKDIEEENDKG